MAARRYDLEFLEPEAGYPKLVTPIVPIRRMDSFWPSQPHRPERGQRQPSIRQGRGLELLGHAVEYLLDSRVFLVESARVKASDDAVHLLKRMSRTIFEECPFEVHALAAPWLVDAQPVARTAEKDR